MERNFRSRCQYLVVVFAILKGSGTFGENSYRNLAEDVSCGLIANPFTKTPRILGGIAANEREFPFLASIQDSDGKHFCSGFIVKEQYLLTAAHCFIDTLFGSNSYKDYQILAGSNNWDQRGNGSNLFKISKIIIHPEYSYFKPNVENDIAILKIDRRVRWSSQVQPICLASPERRDPQFGVTAGWGIRSKAANMKEWMKDTRLHKVSLPIWRNSACQLEYRKDGINWNTKSSHICAGYQGSEKDTCQGDSGSPLLVVDGNGRRVAFGIVSVGEGCATKLPGIYTRISSFIPWIEENSR